MNAWIANTARFGPWGLAVVVGFTLALRYETAAGEVATSPLTWPAGSSVTAAGGGRSTLLLFAHPKCPCTRATVEELATLMHDVGRDVDATVLFVRPSGVALGWERTPLWEAAAKIAGVTVVADEGGAEAMRFGAVTSGLALLYAPDGRLLFSGGITATRGHAGDNAGRSSIEALLERRSPARHTTPVYGCRLLGRACDGGNATCTR